MRGGACYSISNITITMLHSARGHLFACSKNLISPSLIICFLTKKLFIHKYLVILSIMAHAADILKTLYPSIKYFYVTSVSVAKFSDSDIWSFENELLVCGLAEWTVHAAWVLTSIGIWRHKRSVSVEYCWHQKFFVKNFLQEME
jgi:hypothetical protein